jgi:hypothetical protein
MVVAVEVVDLAVVLALEVLAVVAQVAHLVQTELMELPI